MLSGPQQIHDRVCVVSRSPCLPARPGGGCTRDSRRDATLGDYVVALDRFRGVARIFAWKKKYIYIHRNTVSTEWSSGRLVTTRDAHTGARARTGNAFSRLTVTASVRVNVLTGAYLTVLDE